VIKVIPGPDWTEARALMRKYPERLAWVKRRIVYDIAQRFLWELQKRVPKGENYDGYKESLKLVEITGMKGDVAFAVISERDKTTIGALKEKKSSYYVIYVEPRGAVGEMSDIVNLVTMNNPWTTDTLPSNIPDSKVEMINREVTKSEFDFIREETNNFLAGARTELKRSGASWFKPAEDVEYHVDSYSTLPDYMWLGIRTEFGINMAGNPHWRPAIQDAMKRVGEIIRKDQEIQKALYDQNYTGYLKAGEQLADNMSQNAFNNEASEFQDKVGKMVGGDIR